MTRKTLFIGSALVLLLGFVAAVLIYSSQRTAATEEAARRSQAVLVRFHSPTLGPAEAKVHVVEFLDPACETCAAFYPFVKRMMAANPGKIRLTIRYAPFHQGSDQVVAALEAARKQGRYWEALEALLASQAQWAPHHTARIDLAWQPLARAGVDVAQARTDMRSPEITRIIAQDVEDARTLNVTKTPEYFVNGRPLPSFGYEQLKRLVDDALAASYR